MQRVSEMHNLYRLKKNKSTNGVSLPFYVRLVKCIRRGKELSWLKSCLAFMHPTPLRGTSSMFRVEAHRHKQKEQNIELFIFHTLNVHNSHSQLSLIDAPKETK